MTVPRLRGPDVSGFFRELASHDYHLPSAWWLDVLERWYDSDKPRLAACVGRSGNKSTIMRGLAVMESVIGHHVVPKGERHYAMLISARKEEVSAGLANVQGYLKSLGVPHRKDGDTILLSNAPRGIRCVAANPAAVSGWRCYFAGVDELAVQRGEGSVSPVVETLSALSPTMVSHPNAKAFMCSSPKARIGYFFDVIDSGDTPTTMVVQAPTWVANTSITRNKTRQLEPDPNVWRREYAAEFLDTVNSAFSSELVDAAMAPLGDNVGRVDHPVLVIDPSKLGPKADGFAHVIACWCTDTSAVPKLVVEVAHTVEGRSNASDVVARIIHDARRNDVSRAFGDQGVDDLLREPFRRAGLILETLPFTPASKSRAVSMVRRWLHDRTLKLPNDRVFRDQLVAFEEHATDGGNVVYRGGGGHHDDLVDCLLVLALAESARKVPGSPYRPKDPPPRGSTRKLMFAEGDSAAHFFASDPVGRDVVDRIAERQGLVPMGGGRDPFGGF